MKTSPNSHRATERGPQQETARILIRVALRLALLIALAAVAKIGFATAFSALLMLMTYYCALAGSIRREHPLGPAFTHFDEAAGYACLSALVARIT